MFQSSTRFIKLTTFGPLLLSSSASMFQSSTRFIKLTTGHPETELGSGKSFNPLRGLSSLQLSALSSGASVDRFQSSTRFIKLTTASPSASEEPGPRFQSSTRFIKLTTAHRSLPPNTDLSVSILYEVYQAYNLIATGCAPGSSCFNPLRGLSSLQRGGLAAPGLADEVSILYEVYQAYNCAYLKRCSKRPFLNRMRAPKEEYTRARAPTSPKAGFSRPARLRAPATAKGSVCALPDGVRAGLGSRGAWVLVKLWGNICFTITLGWVSLKCHQMV